MAVSVMMGDLFGNQTMETKKKASNGKIMRNSHGKEGWFFQSVFFLNFCFYFGLPAQGLEDSENSGLKGMASLG